MFIRALTILAMAASVAAAGYAIIAYHFPPQPSESQQVRRVAEGDSDATSKKPAPLGRSADEAQPSGARSPIPSSSLTIGAGVRIEQNSAGNNSPNVVSG